MVFALFYQPILYAQVTLCSTYGSQTPTHTVGVGSPNNITHSSQLGSSLPSGSVVNVVGDFIVNADFTLSGSIVKVNTGAKIFVEANGSFSLVFLMLNNTKVFACSGLWKGIELDNFTGITTTNGTQIEDAESAIKSTAGFASLSIDNTTFNRNVIGINLEVPINTWWPPMLTLFVNNAFSCTSPLNGTTNGKTEVGVRMKNINYPLVFNYGNTNNTFKGLKNGMYMEADYMVMDLDNYRFLGIEYNCVEFRNGEQLFVKNCKFEDIKREGIITNNARSLRVEDSEFLGSNSAPYTLYNRKMLHVLNPKVGNTNLIQRNVFTTSGDLNCLTFSHILLEINGGLNNQMNASISANTFNLLNNFNTSNNFNLGYSIGVQVSSNYSTSSDVDIENNDFILDANNSGSLWANSALDVRGGNKNNVHIIANRIKAGRGYFCSMVGSMGTGNEFSDNVFNQGQYGHLGYGLFVDNFKNTRICSNTNNAATVVAYHFNGQNDNTNFTSNTTYGNSQYSVRFGNNAPYIGQQKHKGNEWYPESCFQSPNFTCHPYIYHLFPGLVELSRFIVHTPQSDLDVNSGNYNYFSSYFPYFIEPDAISSGFWITDMNGTPSNTCLVQRPNPEGFNERLIAQNGLSDYLDNPVQQYDAEMHLYRSIKADPSAFNGNRAYSSFLQRNAGKNKDKFTDLENAIDESGKVKEQRKNRIADLKSQTKALEMEAKRYSKANPASLDAIKNWCQRRFELDNRINTQYKEHKSEQKVKQQAAKRILDNATPLAANERLIKEVYAIYLDAQLNNEGKFTAEQTARLKAIAQICVTEGGMIVYVARGFLSQNDLHEIQGIIDVCEPRSQPESTQRLEVTPTRISERKQSKVAVTTLYPNPAGESFTINVADNLTATAQITDITGKVMNVYNLQTGTNTIHHDLQKGMYIVTIKMSNGKALTQKLSINY